jgi:hypothetical protein
MRKPTPLHEHDCNACEYITSTMGNDNAIFDWYVHAPAHGGQGGTVIGRYGELSEYLSYPFFMLTDDRYNYSATLASDTGRVVEPSHRIVAKEILRRYKETHP